MPFDPLIALHLIPVYTILDLKEKLYVFYISYGQT